MLEVYAQYDVDTPADLAELLDIAEARLANAGYSIEPTQTKD